MKTLNVNPAAPEQTSRHVGSTRRIQGEIRMAAIAENNSAIDRQLNEIQRTFGVRWEW